MMVLPIKVYKKVSPNGKLMVYVTKRDIIDHMSFIDPIEGVVVTDKGHLKDRQVFIQVVVLCRYGDKEDEEKIKKEIIVMNDTAKDSQGDEMCSHVQTKLLEKFGENAEAFCATAPPEAPPSVTLHSESDKSKRPLGVEYELRVFIGKSKDDIPSKRNLVTLAIRKVQFYIPMIRYRPFVDVEKGFPLSTGKLRLECSLERDVYYHGDKIGVSIVVRNESKKTVKAIKLEVLQHCDVVMIDNQYSKPISQMTTREGCPIAPGVVFTKEFFLSPAVTSDTKTKGLAFDGRIKDEDVNLATSSEIETDKSPSSMCGIVVSYSIKVALQCGLLLGDVSAEVAFKLLHPPLGRMSFLERENAKTHQLMERLSSPRGSLTKTDTVESEKLEFEDFKRTRSCDDLLSED